jgi:hypothetical protein
MRMMLCGGRRYVLMRATQVNLWPKEKRRLTRLRMQSVEPPFGALAEMCADYREARRLITASASRIVKTTAHLITPAEGLYQGTTSQAAEKLTSGEQNQDSSGLKPLGMTKNKELVRRG